MTLEIPCKLASRLLADLTGAFDGTGLVVAALLIDYSGSRPESSLTRPQLAAAEGSAELGCFWLNSCKDIVSASLVASLLSLQITVIHGSQFFFYYAARGPAGRMDLRGLLS